VIPVVYDLLDRRADSYYAERGRRARRERVTEDGDAGLTGEATA
jgi:HAE1 family hydrophobic/amphiphilic exporter-1